MLLVFAIPDVPQPVAGRVNCAALNPHLSSRTVKRLPMYAFEFRVVSAKKPDASVDCWKRV